MIPRLSLVLLLALLAACSGPSHKTAISPTHSPSAEPSSLGHHIPAWLQIPSIGVNAKVEAVGLDQKKNVGVPSSTQTVAWYKGGPTPGEFGNAILDGHLDWTNVHCPRRAGEPTEAVFCKLSQVKPLAPVTVVSQDGTNLHFKVLLLSTIPWDASVPGLFSTLGMPRLSLITCGGTWDQKDQTYTQRLVVTAIAT